MAFIRIITRAIAVLYALIALAGAWLAFLFAIHPLAWETPVDSTQERLELLWFFLGQVCATFAGLYILATEWHGRFYYLAFPAALIVLMQGVTNAAASANARDYPANATILNVPLVFIESLVLAGGVLIAATGFWKEPKSQPAVLPPAGMKNQ